MKNWKDELAELTRLNERVNEFEKLDASIIAEVKRGNPAIIDKTLVAKQSKTFFF